MAWKAKHPNEKTGKTSLVYNSRSAAQPDNPIIIGCGQCIGCKIKKSQDWAIRITHEAQYHEENIFLTLTFSDQELARRENPGSVDVKDVQKFVKRLREHTSRKMADTPTKGKLRYFACGEYGEKTGRPHYHLLVFGYKPYDGECFKTSRKGSKLYRAGTLDQLWPHGHINYGETTWDSASYCAGYITKKYNANDCGDRLKWKDPLTGKLKDKNPEFSLMSRRPPIGTQWIEDNYQDVYRDDYVVIKGKKRSLPRYYDNWMEKYHPEWMQEIKDKRLLEFMKQPHITDERRLDIHLAKWHHHTQRLRDTTDNESDDILDLRQQSESVPKAILHAKRRHGVTHDTGANANRAKS